MYTYGFCDEFLRRIFVTNIFFTYNFLTIASFSIGVHSILLFAEIRKVTLEISTKILVFCFQKVSDLWGKIVLLIEKNFSNSRLKAENL